MTSRQKRIDLATLTGVRSGKTSYYRAYVRSDERMQDAVRAMDSISRALVRTVEGPRGLLEEVVRAAAAIDPRTSVPPRRPSVCGAARRALSRNINREVRSRNARAAASTP